MLTKDMHINEILENLEGKGDFVKIDYLTKFIEQRPGIGMRKFAFLKLAEIYFHKGLLKDSAKMFHNAGINSVTFKEKQKNFLKEAKTLIISGEYENSDKAIKNAISEANKEERLIIFNEFRKFYKEEMQRVEKTKKSGKIIKIYKKLITMKYSEEEKTIIRGKLIELYERLGMNKELELLDSNDNYK